MSLFLKKMRDHAIFPRRGTDGAAGYDLRAAEPMDLDDASKYYRVPVGWAFQLPHGIAMCIKARSSSTDNGFEVEEALVDEDYRGEVFVKVRPLHHGVRILQDQRIAQFILVVALHPLMAVVDTLDDTARGAGGFGSTGKF